MCTSCCLNPPYIFSHRIFPKFNNSDIHICQTASTKYYKILLAHTETPYNIHKIANQINIMNLITTFSFCKTSHYVWTILYVSSTKIPEYMSTGELVFLEHAVRYWADMPWWRHQMKKISASLAICAGNSPVPGEFPHKGQWRGALMFSFICT